MKKLKKLIVALAITMFLALFSVAPALAEHGSGSGSNPGSGSGSSGANTNSVTSDSGSSPSTSPNSSQTETIKQEAIKKATEKAKAEAETHTKKTENEAKDKIDSQGDTLLKKFKAEVRVEKSAAEREKTCQLRKHGLEKKFTNYLSNAKKHKANFDEDLTKAVSFQTDKNLSSSDLTGLLSAAQTSGSQAESSITILSGLSPSVDCNNSTVAGNVATFKAAVDQVKTDLNSYRKAIKTFVQALKAAAPAEVDTKTESAQ